MNKLKKLLKNENMRIPIVNEQDEIIGYKEREGLDPFDFCRVTGLWVTDKDGNILLAQRSFRKKTDPGCWGPAVAGTVEESETYESSILREAEEELGLKNIKPIKNIKVFRNTNHKYWGQWFTLVVDRDIHLKIQESEVAQIKWFSPNEVVKMFSENPNAFNKSFGDTLKEFGILK
jgi:isopentenyldiphosphate isomerase